MSLYNDAFNSPVRRIKAKVELYNGSTLVNTFAYDDALQSIVIERAGENSKFFGFGVTNKANIKLRDKDKEISVSTANHFKVYFAINDEDYYDGFPELYVTEVNRDETTGALSITCYDKIYFLTGNYFSELTLEAPYSVEDVANAVATFTGKPILKRSINDMAFEVMYDDGINAEGTENLREVIDDIAEATQTFYYLNNANLVFRRFDATPNNNTPARKNAIFNFKQKTSRRLGEICSCTELGDNISAKTNLTGTTQYVRNNMFWDLREDRATLVENAVAAVGNQSLVQFEAEWRGNFTVEYGDLVSFQDKDGISVRVFLLNDTLEYDGGLKQKTSWAYEDNEGETASNPSNLGEALKYTYAQVDKINKEIQLVASDVSDNKETLANIQVTADGLSSTVQQVEKNVNDALEDINQDIEELTKRVNTTVTAEDLKIQIETQLKETGSVNAVVTSTGFTFNEDGLSIEKSGSEMSTQITEDGMTVKKDDEVMLTANNQGVVARNLHAETYLIIGKNSRFEDMGDTRTACFWIGD